MGDPITLVFMLLFGVAALIIAVVMIVAQCKLFSIAREARTQTEILATIANKLVDGFQLKTDPEHLDETIVLVNGVRIMDRSKIGRDMEALIGSPVWTLSNFRLKNTSA